MQPKIYFIYNYLQSLISNRYLSHCVHLKRKWLLLGLVQTQRFVHRPDSRFDVRSKVFDVHGSDDDNNNLNKLIYHNQTNGLWPFGHPLPLPVWKNETMKPYKLKSLREYESLACEIEMHLQQLLEKHNYDTVGNFVEFYNNFRLTNYTSLFEFFQM